jgi:hypothetical protein
VPLSVLLCEGVAGGPDTRILFHILRGVVGVVQPYGGKDGLPVRVAARREMRTDAARSCCALGDGDFPRDPEVWNPSDEARPWIDKQGMRIGWLWRRKEIENYLLDPSVLAHVFAWSDEQRGQYEQYVRAAWEKATVSTAARMALTCHAPVKGRLETGIEPHLDRDAVRERLLARAHGYNADQHVDTTALEERWIALLPECEPGGRFFANAATIFAGKDVFSLLVNQKGIQGFQPELKSKAKLVERVLQAMEKDEAPHEWLPEWRSLRAAVSAWSPSD